jgi:LmbE family N-acetylglucosaminyl deacetylase
LWEGVFQLLYSQHGGSGLCLTLSEVMELDMERISWLLERLGQQRHKEAREIEQAARRGRRR